ncbi:hypothetical protein Taro_012819 [Colocasia esculenta]|uniref:Uncharacterized protein n=1 Tax=Colocasia esculenta TaxID=4460 RepID=A0A843UEM0_COLES|nr:hypothetical protein [Colocasia esculenta]
MNEAGPSHNLNENLELHDTPVINDKVLENSESDGDDDNDNIQSSSDDDVNDDTNMSRPITDNMKGEDNVLLYAQESHRSNDPQIIWEPYALEDLSHAAVICRESSELWRAHVPMFCKAVMEVHMLERVWRQFGAPQVDVTFRTRELLITNPKASYLDVKKEILKLQEYTLNKLRIKIPEYEQPSITFGAEYTPGESSGGPNTWAHPWTSEQWPNIYDAQSRGIS